MLSALAINIDINEGSILAVVALITAAGVLAERLTKLINVTKQGNVEAAGANLVKAAGIQAQLAAQEGAAPITAQNLPMVSGPGNAGAREVAVDLINKATIATASPAPAVPATMEVNMLRLIDLLERLQPAPMETQEPAERPA